MIPSLVQYTFFALPAFLKVRHECLKKDDIYPTYTEISIHAQDLDLSKEATDLIHASCRHGSPSGLYNLIRHALYIRNRVSKPL